MKKNQKITIKIKTLYLGRPSREALHFSKHKITDLPLPPLLLYSSLFSGSMPLDSQTVPNQNRIG